MMSHKFKYFSPSSFLLPRNILIFPPPKKKPHKIIRFEMSYAQLCRPPAVSHSSPPSPHGTLDTLPPELRNSIYALVFSAGYTALAQTSKSMHAVSRSRIILPAQLPDNVQRMQDTQEAFRRHSVWRVHIDDLTERKMREKDQA